MHLFFKRPPTEQIRQTALEYCLKVKKPILIGRLAIGVGWWWSIADTEVLLKQMVAEGILRELTEEERQQFDVRFGYAVV